MAHTVKVRRSGPARAARLMLGWAAGLAAALVLLAWLSEPAAAQQSPVPGVRLMRSDADSVLIELSAPSYSLTTRTEGGETFSELSVPGMSPWSARPAFPQLPMKGLMLGVPQDAEIAVRVVSEDVSELPLAHRLLPSQSYAEAGLPASAADVDSAARYVPDAGAYARAGWAPTDTVILNSVGYVRSQRIAQINLYPFRYDASLGRLRWARVVRVEVRFIYSSNSRQAHGVYRDEGVFESTLRGHVLNYESARAWRQPVARPTATTETGGAPRATALAGGLFRVSVRGEGIYRLSYADLVAAGVPPGTDPHTFKIIKNGSEVPIYVNGEANGVFDSNDFVEFFAQSINTVYSDINVYWFTYGGANGQRMSVRSGAPAGGATPPAFTTTVHAEENHLYDNSHPNGNGDHWFWNVARTPGLVRPFWYAAPVVYTTTLSDVDLSAPMAALRIRVCGYSGSGGGTLPHHALYYLNGVLVGDDAWTGDVVHDFTTSVTQSILISGPNYLSVSVPNDGGYLWDGIAMNWFEIDYQRDYQARDDYLAFQAGITGPVAITVTAFSTNAIALYDVTIPTQTVRLTGAVLSGSGPYALAFGDTLSANARYVAAASAKQPLSIVRDSSASDLRNPANGADYIVIAYDDFFTATAPLETLRTAQGLRVVRARISNVYDEFSDGVFDANAIRNFLTYAYDNWQAPAPQFVVLVGDGNLNYRNYYPNSVGPLETNYIPPYLDAVDIYGLNEVAVDNRYVNIVGDDIVPDMAIGRLPARSVAETTAMVNKIVAYEQSPAPSAWRSTVDFFTDNYLSASGAPDPGGDFYATADGIIDGHIPTIYSATRVYYNPYLAMTGTQFYSTPAAARNAITQSINSGALFANYIGHANRPLWAAEGLMGNADAVSYGVPNVFASVANGARQPVVLELACFTGGFQYPGFTTMAETFMLADGYGAIADWASSGFGVNQGHDMLAGFFYDGIFQYSMRRVGLATVYSKLGLAAAGVHADLIDEFTLFGDPATSVNLLPVADLVITQRAPTVGFIDSSATIRYVLQYTNTGETLATNVLITDIVPAGLLSPSFSFSGANVTGVGGLPFVWTVADLGYGAGGLITISASVDTAYWLSATAPLTNSAVISSAAYETALANNVTSAVTRFTIPLKTYLPLVFR